MNLRPGLRTIGFERRATIAFTVKGEDVIILRILYGGRSLDLAFGESS
jgi:toxin ParE1/3/4